MKIQSLGTHPHSINSHKNHEPTPPEDQRGPLKKAVDWIDDYTSPRESTSGNFKKASYFQAAFQGGTEGFYLMGLPGVASGASAAITGAFVQNKTGSQVAGVLAGTAVGAGLGAAVAGMSGQPLAHLSMLGGIIGCFQTIRAHGEAKIRDSGGNATMISAFFVPGPAKVAGGIGAAMGARFESPAAQAAVGAASGAALGAGLAAIGFAPVSVARAALGSAAAGAIGPFVGPRFSQLFRNLAEDIGEGVEKGAQKIGLIDGEMSQKTTNAIGSIPSSFIKEGLRGFQFSDGGLAGFVIGGLMESVQQAHIAMFSGEEKPVPPESEGEQQEPPRAA